MANSLGLIIDSSPNVILTGQPGAEQKTKDDTNNEDDKNEEEKLQSPQKSIYSKEYLMKKSVPILMDTLNNLIDQIVMKPDLESNLKETGARER